jgi:hypothetical protein
MRSNINWSISSMRDLKRQKSVSIIYGKGRDPKGKFMQFFALAGSKMGPSGRRTVTPTPWLISFLRSRLHPALAQKQGIRNRLRKYTVAKKWGPTADRVRAGIAQALSTGQEVRLLYLTPVAPENLIRADSRNETESAHDST